MTNNESPPPTPSTASTRRASFTPGAKLSDLWGRSPPTSNIGVAAYPGPIATAAANAQAQQRRRTSISLALGGSPTNSSSFSGRNRQSSTTSSNSPSTSMGESAIEEGDAPSQSSSPTSPFIRRMSFGARALRDARSGGGGASNVNGRASNTMASAPSIKGRGEGFDWSEQIKNRAERSASMTQRPSVSPAAAHADGLAKTASAGQVEQLSKDVPRPQERQKPDHFQERILKGDFYMD